MPVTPSGSGAKLPQVFLRKVRAEQQNLSPLTLPTGLGMAQKVGTYGAHTRRLMGMRDFGRKQVPAHAVNLAISFYGSPLEYGMQARAEQSVHEWLFF